MGFAMDGSRFLTASLLVLSQVALHGGSAYPTNRAAIREVQKLIPFNGTQPSEFGSALALDGSTLAVSADSFSTLRGAVYVFERANGTWQLTFDVAGTNPGDQLGCRLALQGDTLAACALSDEQGADAGSVRIYRRVGGSWQFETTLLTSDGQGGDLLGTVALDGNRIVAGAIGADDANPTNPETNSGAAYVFVRSGTSWTEEAKLVPSDTSPGDLFGSAVAIEGDTILIGASELDPGGGAEPGAAYVYQRIGAAWVEQQKLVPSGATAAWRFGFSVGLSGDSALVGAPSGALGGAVEVYEFDGTQWVWTEQLTDPAGECCSQFGRSLELSGDLAVIGAPGSTGPSGDQVGTAYVFGRPGDRWIPVWRLETSVPLDPLDAHGLSVALGGSDVAVGAPCDDDGGVAVGAVYVYRPGLPFSYCTGKTSSLGCVPFVATSGLPSATSTSPFRVTGNGVLPNEAGVLFYGFSKSNLNFHNGKLCVKAPLDRWLPAKKAKATAPPPCSGVLSRNFNARIQAGADPALTVGRTVRAQWLYRDPGVDFFGDGLTDALQFTILP